MNREVDFPYTRYAVGVLEHEMISKVLIAKREMGQAT